MKQENKNIVMYISIIIIALLLYFPYYEIYHQRVEYKQLEKKYKHLQGILNRPVGSNEYKTAEETIKELREYNKELWNKYCSIAKDDKECKYVINTKTTKNGIKYKVLD